MNAVWIVVAMFFFAFGSAFVPLLSIELALVVSSATAVHPTLLALQVVAAAAGQMVGKSCIFVGARRVFERRVPARLAWLLAWAGRRRLAAAATVLASAFTGLPPFAVVSALAGGWRLRLRAFYLLGFAGRAARFGAVVAAPGLVGFSVG